MNKNVFDFRGSKVAKTLIFYTHTHTHTHLSIAEQKKSPMAILRGATERSIRYFCLRLFGGVIRFKRRSVRKGLLTLNFYTFTFCMDLPLNRIVF